MDRREALKTTGIALGGLLAASTGVLAACGRGARPIPGRVLNEDDQALMEQIADTIFPTTKASPGARAAGAGPAINLLLTDCHEPPDQQRVINGLTDFRATCRQRQGADFSALTVPQREQFLRSLDADAKKAGDSHYFHLVRQLASDAYFSSEIGMTKALRYIRVPGKFIGCVPLAPGQPAWG